MAASNTDRTVLNFYAGPTALPSPVIARLREDILDFHGTGMGVMEISHRAPEIEGLIADTAAPVRRLLGLSAEFEVLFLQGGGSLQFAMIPMNFSAPRRTGSITWTPGTGRVSRSAKHAQTEQGRRDRGVVRRTGIPLYPARRRRSAPDRVPGTCTW